jgi:phage protein D
MTELLENPEPMFWVDHQRVATLTRDALELAVEEELGGLKRLELMVAGQPTSAEGDDDASLLYLDGTLDFGRTIAVSVGSGARARTVFEGAVSALGSAFEEGEGARIQVLAEDKAMQLRMTRRSKTYQHKTDAQIAEEIAREHQLRADVAAEGPTHDYVQQWNQSDLAFLRDRAARIQADVWVRGDTLFFKTRDRRTGSLVTLVRGNELMSVSVSADLAHQRTAIKVSGWSAPDSDRIERQADGRAVRAEVSGGRTGPEVLEQAFGARPSQRVRDVPLVAGEAEAWSKAELLRRARGFVTARGTTNGTPDLEVGSRVTLERVGRPFEGGEYFVTRVRHTWNRRTGFRTHFEAERARINEG